MLKQIEQPEQYELIRFNGVDATHVYLGGFYGLKSLDLKWRKERIEEIGEEWECLTLEEIKQQAIEVSKYEEPLITVFIQEPFKGIILQYGNYGDSWWKIGETCGYA
jgi:hypothetical protein